MKTENEKTSQPYVLWLMHNSHYQIDGGHHYGGVFDSFEDVANEIERHMDSFSISIYQSRQELLDAFVEDDDDWPQWAKDQDWAEEEAAWPLVMCDGEIFDSEEEAYTYAAERCELGWFGQLEDCDEDELRLIAIAEWSGDLGEHKLTEDESVDEDQYPYDEIEFINCETDESRTVPFDDSVIAAVISRIWPYPDRTPAEIKDWLVRLRREREEAKENSQLREANRRKEALEKSKSRFIRLCKEHKVSTDQVKQALIAENIQPTSILRQVQSWAGPLRSSMTTQEIAAMID